MEKQRHGIIANFSSSWGQSTAPEVTPTVRANGSRRTHSPLAQELSDGLATVAFNPGIIDTDMLRSCFGEGHLRMKARPENMPSTTEKFSSQTAVNPLLDSIH